MRIQRRTCFKSSCNSGTRTKGWIIKHDSAIENDTEDYGQLKFFGKETNI